MAQQVYDIFRVSAAPGGGIERRWEPITLPELHKEYVEKLKQFRAEDRNTFDGFMEYVDGLKGADMLKKHEAAQ